MEQVEKVARALASADGQNPDAQSHITSHSQWEAISRGEVVRPVWRDYEPEATRLVAALSALELIPSLPR